MASGIPIDGKSYIGKNMNGVVILDVWKGNGGEWRAEVKCVCSVINRMPLRQALSLNFCKHKKKRKKGSD